ncbi:unnamed protein product, partial [Pylaiella littoralis]
MEPRSRSRSSCGRAVHGKQAPGGAMLCFACGRAGARDGASVGSEEATVTCWWAHPRDLVAEPLTPRECVCSRDDCAFKLYEKFCKQRATAERM